MFSGGLHENRGGEGEKRIVNNTKRRQMDLDCLLADCCSRIAQNAADADALMTRGSLHLRKGKVCFF